MTRHEPHPASADDPSPAEIDLFATLTARDQPRVTPAIGGLRMASGGDEGRLSAGAARDGHVPAVGDGERLLPRPADDEYLLAALRIAAGVDPVPERVGTDARAVFALRLPGAVLAGPLEPQPGLVADARPLAGVRSDGCPADDEPRLLRFGADGLTIDMEVTVRDSHLDLAGQVHPAPVRGARIEIRTPHISKIRFPTENGLFATTGLPHGWLSVVYHRPGDRPVATRWHCVRQ
ncbi:hypothetical protein AB0M95_08020 [Sphaerisporangium sp. NPDC051017]|uniref:hypothetical protein n=1 Tax=Sphaerisporangium sp. NPDC051017 TaxID=3154636 RepID=UPI00341B284E